jgi:hypothetical protein
LDSDRKRWVAVIVSHAEKFEANRRGDFLSVGDSAYRDEEGFCYICDQRARRISLAQEPGHGSEEPQHGVSLTNVKGFSPFNTSGVMTQVPLQVLFVTSLTALGPLETYRSGAVPSPKAQRRPLIGT